MIKPGTRLKAADNSGALEIECINLVGSSTQKSAGLGDFITASVKKARAGGSVEKKDIVKAVIIRQKKPVRRDNGTWIRFDDNAALLLEDNSRELIGNRIQGPVPVEIKEDVPTVTSIASEII